MIVVLENVRSIRGKVDEFACSISQEEFDFVALSETWLSAEISSSEFFPDRYRVFRCDRDFATCGLARGGGVLLALQEMNITADEEKTSQTRGIKENSKYEVELECNDDKSSRED
ncbi:hypothetical protein QE152_g33031 [Popillia japonica]|uniref:Uncharacterized protein n=1 Tax=Popillia japonica TaxID=7064 RepID=A0AAW1IYB7_POPJA